MDIVTTIDELVKEKEFYKNAWEVAYECIDELADIILGSPHYTSVNDIQAARILTDYMKEALAKTGKFKKRG